MKAIAADPPLQHVSESDDDNCTDSMYNNKLEDESEYNHQLEEEEYALVSKSSLSQGKVKVAPTPNNCCL